MYKSLEHIVHNNVMNHFQTHKILHDSQNGFMCRRSCETQLISTLQGITSHLRGIRSKPTHTKTYPCKFGQNIPIFRSKRTHRKKGGGGGGGCGRWKRGERAGKKGGKYKKDNGKKNKNKFKYVPLKPC